MALLILSFFIRACHLVAILSIVPKGYLITSWHLNDAGLIWLGLEIWGLKPQTLPVSQK